MEYRYLATSVSGFVQQLACNYIPHGYVFYVMGFVPEVKDPAIVDAKLLAKYGIAISRQSRARRKKAGLANLHYLRFDRTFVLLATHGKHLFFEEEASRVRDLRRSPLIFEGYSISFKRGNFRRSTDPDQPAIPDNKFRVRVQISRDRFTELKSYFADIALHRSAENLQAELFHLPFEPYAPVRRQVFALVRLVNRFRREAGLPVVDWSVAGKYRRRIVEPFMAVISGKDDHVVANN